MSFSERFERHTDIELGVYSAIIDTRRELVMEVERDSGIKEIYTLWLNGDDVRYYRWGEFYSEAHIEHETIVSGFGLGVEDYILLYEYLYYNALGYEEDHMQFLGDPISKDPLEHWYELMDSEMNSYHMKINSLAVDLIAEIKMSLISEIPINYSDITREYIGDLELYTRLYFDHEDCMYAAANFEDNGVYYKINKIYEESMSGMWDLVEMASNIRDLNYKYGLIAFSRPYIVERTFSGCGDDEFIYEVGLVLEEYDKLVEYWYYLKDKYWEELGEGNEPTYMYELLEGERAKDIRDMVLYENEGEQIYYD